MNKILMSLLAFFIVCACQPKINSRGNITLAEKIDTFVIGKTKKIDVYNACGTPSLQSGKFIWIYMGAKSEEIAFSKPTMINKLVVRLTFDNSDTLKKIEKINDREFKNVDNDVTDILKK